tara:strand:+ start:867 stop:1019 length:153 start_codon:yes stop_codon:yes gene_type:complete
MKAASKFVMKRCVLGGTVLASCLQKKFGITGQGVTQIGVGPLMIFLQNQR